MVSLFVLLNKVPGKKGECRCFKRNLLRALCLGPSLLFPGFVLLFGYSGHIVKDRGELLNQFMLEVDFTSGSY